MDVQLLQCSTMCWYISLWQECAAILSSKQVLFYQAVFREVVWLLSSNAPWAGGGAPMTLQTQAACAHARLSSWAVDA